MNLDEQIASTVTAAVNGALGKLLDRLERVERLTEAKQQGKLLWREPQAAEVLGIAPQTLKKWRCRGLVKSHTPSGTRVPLYAMCDLERIVQQLAEGLNGE